MFAGLLKLPTSFLSISNSVHLSRRTMALLHHVIGELERFAPLDAAEKWDNVGLLIEPSTSKTAKIEKILLTNDLTESVMAEAVQKRVNMIISYHPPIFAALKRISQSNWKERIVVSCLENKIALYSPHTAWDAAQNGVNDWLWTTVGLSSSTGSPIHTPDPNQPNVGAGRIYDLPAAVPLDQIIKNLHQGLALTDLQLALAEPHKPAAEHQIKRIALCAGSGASCFKNTAADLYLTGEMSHHEVLDAVHRGTSVILTNHSNSERGFLRHIKERFQTILPDCEFILSAQDGDPLKTVSK